MLNYIICNWTGTLPFWEVDWGGGKGKESLLCFPFFLFFFF